MAVQKDFERGREPKILVWDTEIAPAVTLSFNFFKASPYRIVRPKQIITLCYKWYGDDRIYGWNVSDFPSYRAGKTMLHGIELLNDLELIEKFLEAFEQADAVIGHNMKGFDIKYLRQRAAFHKLRPINEPIIIDTLTQSRNLFNIERNTLDYLCEYFGLPRKTKRRYDDLIDGFLMGDKKDQADMKKYCKQDVIMSDLLYSQIAPWMKLHPNFNQFRRSGTISCKVCGANRDRLMKKGLDRSPRRYNRQKYYCKDCGHRFRGERLEKDVEPYLES